MTPRARAFRQVDVFTQQAYQGNGLAVVMDGSGLSQAQMQAFAQWTQLSETTFLLPPTAPEAHYQVRIFTPGGELPFAGHPTLGSCHAWLEAGGQTQDPDWVIQQCAIGLVRIHRQGAHLAFAAPALRRSAVDASLLAEIRSALGLSATQVLASQRLDNGPIWFGLLLDSAITVRQLQPDHGRLRALGTKVGVAARLQPVALPAGNASSASICAPGHEADLLVRAFAAPIGIAEDPVTGSLNASLAQWLMEEGLMQKNYRASQGSSIGRDGRVHLQCDDQGQVWVGGTTLTCINGQVWL